jgi:hypothetical protein
VADAARSQLVPAAQPKRVTSCELGVTIAVAGASRHFGPVMPRFLDVEYGGDGVCRHAMILEGPRGGGLR